MRVFFVQVLDDSTDKLTRSKVDDKVMEWRERGVDVVCVRRTNRQGHKAGALKEVKQLDRQRGEGKHIACNQCVPVSHFCCCLTMALV